MFRPAIRLFLLGFVTLFMELVLIRYLAGNVWNMGYFPNLVLLAAFLGMGFGFAFHQWIPETRSLRIFHYSGLALLFLVGFVYRFHPAVPGFNKIVGKIGDEVFFTSTQVDTGAWDFLIFVLLFSNIVLIFFLISQHTAKLFSGFAPLRAYTLDILGSCCGILCFILFSLLQIPAYGWLLSVIVFFAAISRGWLRISISLMIGLAAVIVWLQDSRLLSRPDYEGPFEVRWSPYQKVESAGVPGQAVEMFVNGIDHQVMFTREMMEDSFYLLPHLYRRKVQLPPYRDVLVIGAGSGNDVAAALQHHAVQVDAVEIDPVIANAGRNYHPLQPYSDPRVHLIIDDGRAFMTRTTRRYDLIIFALTDSLVKVSPVAQLRLENYIFTEESVRLAFSLLKPGGDLIFYNSYRYPWVRDKIKLLAYYAGERLPIVLQETGAFSMFLVSNRDEPVPAPRIPASFQAPRDDWPFLYLKSRGIPSLYRNVMIGILALILVLGFTVRARERKQRGSPQDPPASLWIRAAFVFMGVAFLLLETKSVIQFSLLFGTTWLNSSLVFLAVLLFVLMANWTVQLLARRHDSLLTFLNIAYALLMIFCIAALYFPLSNLLKVENMTLRFLLASVLTFSPVFFANLIFSLTFRNRRMAETLFGWNLIGAAFGGVLEYSSMGLGYNALGVIVAVSYTLVFLFLRMEFRQVRSVTI